jgi:hypothetical protein
VLDGAQQRFLGGDFACHGCILVISGIEVKIDLSRDKNRLHAVRWSGLP